MIEYKGYVGTAHGDTEAGVVRSRVINTRDTIAFQGPSSEELRRAFEESIDDYLEFCGSRGEAPEKPFSGRFVVRIKPDLHRALAAEASRRGRSLNTLITRRLAKFAKATPTTTVSNTGARPDPPKRRAKPARKAGIKPEASGETPE